ncbi:MAG: hypothetical protein WBG65_03885 [Sulfurimonadaceae bacterium]
MSYTEEDVQHMISDLHYNDAEYDAIQEAFEIVADGYSYITESHNNLSEAIRPYDSAARRVEELFESVGLKGDEEARKALDLIETAISSKFVSASNIKQGDKDYSMSIMSNVGISKTRMKEIFEEFNKLLKAHPPEKTKRTNQ